jgi:hypothetical protein
MQRQVPHDFQQAMSSESTPNLTFALPFFEIFMTQLGLLGEKFPIIKPWTDLAEEKATKYYRKMDETDAYVMNMCTFLYLYTALSLT